MYFAQGQHGGGTECVGRCTIIPLQWFKNIMWIVKTFQFSTSTFEPRHEKTSILVSNLVQHKPGCTATEDGLRLEISDL